MKPTYINNIPLMQGEVSVVMSDSVTDSVRHSAELACAIRRSGVNALLLNCGMSDQQFRHIANPIVAESPQRGESGVPMQSVVTRKARIEMRSCVRGNVATEGDAIYQIVRDAKIAVLIINSWEWASASWRRKQSLLFYLRALMEDTRVAVIIYSTAPSQPVAQKPDRGGIGKLSELALYVVHLAETNKLKEKTPRPPAMVVNGHDEAIMERSAQLIREKLKSYGEQKPDDACVDRLVEHASLM